MARLGQRVRTRTRGTEIKGKAGEEIIGKFRYVQKPRKGKPFKGGEQGRVWESSQPGNQWEQENDHSKRNCLNVQLLLFEYLQMHKSPTHSSLERFLQPSASG